MTRYPTVSSAALPRPPGAGIDPAMGQLLPKLCQGEKWQELPLGTLMPGLSAADSSLRENSLSARVVNALRRAGVDSWPDLATMTVASLSQLPRIGPKGRGEILAFAAREWARTFLGEEPAFAAKTVGHRSMHPDDDLGCAFEALEGGVADFEIFRRHRLQRVEPATLQEIGDEMGISRERVRQREHCVREVVARRMEDESWPIRVAADRVRERLGSLARLRELGGVLATLDPDGRIFEGLPDRRALLLQQAGYSVAGAWVQSVDLDARTDAILSAITAHGPASLKDSLRELGKLGIDQSLRLPWLEGRPSFRVVDQLVARESQTLATAAAILQAAGGPLELDDLFARARVEISLASFRSKIRHDGRFRRCGVRRYGLSAWDEERYTTLAEMVAGELDRSGGALHLDVLAELMAERFGVAAASVRKLARTSSFAVDAAGLVSRA